MTNTTAPLEVSTPYTGSDKVVVGNGDTLTITHTGSFSHSSASSSLSFLDVLDVPQITKNLF